MAHPKKTQNHRRFYDQTEYPVAVIALLLADILDTLGNGGWG